MTTNPVQIGPYTIGGGGFTVIAGPCSIESQEQFKKTAQFVGQHGATVLRGGIFKLRTNPHSFHGLRAEALDMALHVKNSVDLPFVSEITDPRQIESLLPIVDAFQVGSRNMYNYELLKELGQLDKPILLKRSFSALIEEWLLAAEHIVTQGNKRVILCERGIRTFETKTRKHF